MPIWYSYTPGGDILVNTGAGKRKARKKANKERKQRTAQNGPEQLN